MPPTRGPEGTLAGVARWVGETETSFRASVPQEAPEAFAYAVLQAGDRRT
jgi:hypothetical protein